MNIEMIPKLNFNSLSQKKNDVINIKCYAYDISSLSQVSRRPFLDTDKHLPLISVYYLLKENQIGMQS